MMEAAVLPSRNCRRLWTFCCKALRKSRLKSRGICISTRHRQCPFKSDMLHTSPESIGPEIQMRSSAADIFTTQPEVPISRPEVSNISDAIPFRNMPGPKGIRNLPVVGNRFHFEPYSKHRMESVVDMRREYMETYGKVYREVLGLGWAVHIHDPLDVATMFRVEGKYPQRGFPSIFQVYDKRENGQVGLGSLIGEEWWRMRKAVQQKLVRPQHMRNFVSRMDQVAQDFIRRIEQVADGQGHVHNMRDELQKLAVEEISAVLFNHRFGCMEGELDPDSEADQLIRATDELFKEFALSTRVFPWFMIFRSPLYQRFRKAGNTIHSIGWKYMLKTMEIAMEKQNLGSDADEEADFITSLLQDKNLSLDYVTTIAMDMFRGAVESTSNTLTFFLHTIARNPEKQERLYAEIDRKLPNKTPVTSGALDHMPYLKACWKESFRLIFPLPAGAPRLLTQDAVMGGYHVPKGTPVFPENAVMCRMEEYFERADEYIPERWLREEESSLYRSPLSQYILVPFGHGVRNCLGRRFAEQNVQVAAIKLLQNFRVECDTEKINVVAQIFQTTDTPLTIRFIPRTGSGNYR